MNNSRRNVALPALASIVMAAASSASCHIDNMYWHFCHNQQEYSPNWPSNIDLEHYEPQICPVKISWGTTQKMQSSGWVIQEGHTIWVGSLFQMLRPRLTPAVDPQYVNFSIFFDGSVRASHSVEYVPGGDTFSRCYDVAQYQLKHPDPQYRVDEPFGKVAITYDYGESAPVDCSGGGGNERRVRTDPIEGV